MVVKSMIQGTVNDYLRTVTSIEIDGHIMIFKSTLKDICIDTKRGVNAKSIMALKKAKRKMKCDKTQVRDKFNVNLPGRENNTVGYLAQLIAVGKYIIDNDIKEFDGYEEFEANHIDYSGNMLTRGFSNNNLYNIELISPDENKLHMACEKRLGKLFGRYFGISGTDTELLNIIRFSDETTLKQYFIKLGNNFEVDEYGTVFIGTAADIYRNRKEIHKKITF